MSKVVFVNMVTFMRFPISIVFCYSILTCPENLISIIFLFGMICATDFFDGRLARKYKAVTKFGAIFDAAADFFFIVTSYAALIIGKMIPEWLFAMVIFKFLEFCLTSFIIGKKDTAVDAVFFFDRLGRTLALLFFAVPIWGITIDYYFSQEAAQSIMSGCGYFLTIIACISSTYRVQLCMQNARIQDCR